MRGRAYQQWSGDAWRLRWKASTSSTCPKAPRLVHAASWLSSPRKVGLTQWPRRPPAPVTPLLTTKNRNRRFIEPSSIPKTIDKWSMFCLVALSNLITNLSMTSTNRLESILSSPLNYIVVVFSSYTEFSWCIFHIRWHVGIIDSTVHRVGQMDFRDLNLLERQQGHPLCHWRFGSEPSGWMLPVTVLLFCFFGGLLIILSLGFFKRAAKVLVWHQCLTL